MKERVYKTVLTAKTVAQVTLTGDNIKGNLPYGQFVAVWVTNGKYFAETFRRGLTQSKTWLEWYNSSTDEWEESPTPIGFIENSEGCRSCNVTEMMVMFMEDV